MLTRLTKSDLLRLVESSMVLQLTEKPSALEKALISCAHQIKHDDTLSVIESLKVMKCIVEDNIRLFKSDSPTESNPILKRMILSTFESSAITVVQTCSKQLEYESLISLIQAHWDCSEKMCGLQDDEVLTWFDVINELQRCKMPQTYFQQYFHIILEAIEYLRHNTSPRVEALSVKVAVRVEAIITLAVMGVSNDIGSYNFRVSLEKQFFAYPQACFQNIEIVRALKNANIESSAIQGMVVGMASLSETRSKKILESIGLLMKLEIPSTLARAEWCWRLMDNVIVDYVGLFALLIKMNVTYISHRWVFNRYVYSISEDAHFKKLTMILELEKADVYLSQNNDLMKMALETTREDLQNPLEQMKYLRSIGADIDQHTLLFKYALEEDIEKPTWLAAFTFLKLCNWGFTENPAFKGLLKRNNAVLLINFLCQYLSHRMLFVYLYLAATENNVAFFKSSYLIEKLAVQLEENNIKAFVGSEEKLSCLVGGMMQAIQSAASQVFVTEGPLNKSTETVFLETILNRLVTTNLETVTLRYDDSFGYCIQFGSEPEICLNQLFGYVDFNHLVMSDELVDSLGRILTRLTAAIDADNKPTAKLYDVDNILTQLPEGAKLALRFYIGYYSYRNINRFFRGVKQEETEKYLLISPAYGKYNLLFNFISGCLVNYAAATIARIYRHQQKGELFLDTCSYDRAENLALSEKEGELLVTKRREMNPQRSHSVQSFSHFAEGSSYFEKKINARTILETPKGHWPTINKGEGEILLPLGTTLNYRVEVFADSAPRFFAREVNSPGLMPFGSPWALCALKFAYHKHLSQPYKAAENHVELNGRRIERPNHGFAHTYRVMRYIDIVLNYYAHHAADVAFQSFCRNITPHQRECLTVAAAFSVTGRESEIAAVEDLKRYAEYRQACAIHLAEFLKLHPATSENSAIHAQLIHMVHYMGNSEFETLKMEGDQTVPDHCIYFHRILNTAHKLDLPRCYGAEKFNHVMAYCRELSALSSESTDRYIEMIRYACDLIAAHGNAYHTTISDADELIDHYKPYATPFEKVSTNFRQLCEVTDSVKKLNLTESYQFDILKSELRV